MVLFITTTIKIIEKLKKATKMTGKGIIHGTGNNNKV